MSYTYNRFEEISKLQSILILPCLDAIRCHKKSYKGICKDLELLGLKINYRTLAQLMRGQHIGFVQLWQFVVLYHYLNIKIEIPVNFAHQLIEANNNNINYINNRISLGDKRYKKLK